MFSFLRWGDSTQSTRLLTHVPTPVTQFIDILRQEQASKTRTHAKSENDRLKTLQDIQREEEALEQIRLIYEMQYGEDEWIDVSLVSSAVRAVKGTAARLTGHSLDTH